MEQAAEFLSARGQTTVTDAANRRRVVRQDRHRQLTRPRATLCSAAGQPPDSANWR